MHINWFKNQICVLGCMLRSHARNGNEFRTQGNRWLPAKHWDAWFLNSSKSKTRLKFMKLGMISCVVGNHGHLWDQGPLAGSAGGMSRCTKSRRAWGSVTAITHAILPRFGPPWGVKPYSCFGGLMVERRWYAQHARPTGLPQGGSGYTHMRVWVIQPSNPFYSCHGPPFIDQGVTTMAK